MPASVIVRFVALTITILTGALSSAQDFKPEEIPPQAALGLFKATNAKDTFYLLTKDQQYVNYSDAGNHYLLVYENGRLRFPRQTSGAVYFDGGSVDLQFENGERLVVPTDRVAVGYLGLATKPMMMSADHAPLNLKKIQITVALLKKLGFDRFIAPGSFIGPRTSNQQSSARRASRGADELFKNPSSVQLVEFIPAAKLDYRKTSDLIERINAIDPSSIKSNDRINQGAFFGHGESIQILVTEPSVSLGKLNTVLSGQGQLKPLTSAALDLYVNYFSQLKLQFRSAPETQKLEIIEAIFKMMGELERYFRFVDYFAQLETAVMSMSVGIKNINIGTSQNTKATRNHPFYGTLMESIRATARVGFETLHQFDHPAAQEILTHTFQEFDNLGLNIVKGRAPNGQYYFDLWLKFMLSELSFIDSVPEGGIEKPADLEVSRSSGGIFQNLNISGDLVSIKGFGIVPHMVDRRPNEILSLLGRPGSKERLKTSLIQYIIDADKKAVKILEWSHQVDKANGTDQFRPRKDSFNATGLTNVSHLLSALAWAFYEQRGLDGFSVTDYQVNVMELFSTLFEIASTSLKTTGTMSALVNASIHILKDVQNNEAIMGAKADPRTLKAAAVLENRLRIFLQRGVEKLAWERSEGAAKACAILLSPSQN